MENIDIAATIELLLGIIILYVIAKLLINSRSEKTVIGHIENAAPYKVETPAPVVEIDQAQVVEAAEASATRTTSRKPAAKKAAAKKPVAKTVAARKPRSKKQ